MFKLLFFFFFCGKLAFGAEPNLLINVKKVEVINHDNPITGECSAIINPEPKENAVTFNFDIKDVVPEDALILVKLDTGNIKKNLKIKLCDAMHELILGQSMFQQITPRDKAPKNCPINPGKLSIEKYLPNKTMIPVGFLQDGLVTLELKFAGPNEEPYFTISAEIEISHDSLVPKMG